MTDAGANNNSGAGVGLAIFVKTPSLSPIKTRLQARSGRRDAEAFHLASAAAVASVALRAQATGSVIPYWAVAETAAASAETWPELPILVQPDGSLGQRMDSIYTDLRARHGAAILIGADTPQLATLHLLQAAAGLRMNGARLLIGTARDGGFWLFGGNTELPSAAWTGVTYSVATTAREFVDTMRPFGDFRRLETLDDVDDFVDLAPVRDAILALPDPTSAQQRVAALISTMLATSVVDQYESDCA